MENRPENSKIGLFSHTIVEVPVIYIYSIPVGKSKFWMSVAPSYITLLTASANLLISLPNFTVGSVYFSNE